MSVHAYTTGDGTHWQVRWREAHGKVRTRSFTSKRDANAFDADIKSRKFKGEALPRPGRETLAAAYNEWFRLAGSMLAPATQRTYRAAWDAHVRGRFDHHRLNELVTEPQLFAEFMAGMRERGVGNAAQRKTLVVISSVLSEAVRWNKLATNPLWGLRKPPGTRQRYPHPFPPVVIERIRRRMLRRSTKRPDEHRGAADSCFVGLMSYAGLRPAEALALRWSDIGERTITVDKAVRDGSEGPTKTGAMRTVPLVAPLRTDLTNFRVDVDSPPDTHLIFPARGGGHWSRSELNNWRGRVWKSVVSDLATGEHPLHQLATARPYDCRASFVSLNLRAGASPLEVAQWAGHSPAVMFRHYAHVIEELVGEPRLSVEDQILRAQELVAGLNQLQLDFLTVDLMERPTIASGGKDSAAYIAYAPDVAGEDLVAALDRLVAPGLATSAWDDDAPGKPANIEDVFGPDAQRPK